MSQNTETKIVVEQGNAQQDQSMLVKIQSSLPSFLPIILIFGVFYFLIIRPQDKKRKQQQQLVDNLKIGQEVVTTAGIYGVISSLNTEKGTVKIKIDKSTEMEILKNAVLNVITQQNDNQKK